MSPTLFIMTGQGNYISDYSSWSSSSEFAYLVQTLESDTRPHASLKCKLPLEILEPSEVWNLS